MTPRDTAVSQALSFLLDAGSSGFKGAWEIQAGFRGTPLLLGTVFPLAFIALTLSRPELKTPEAREVALREASQIVDLGEPQGWRYFNLYPEIPPDADDLAHVIHLLVRLDWPDRHAILEGPLAFAERNFHPDGSCNTWLVEDPALAHDARKAWAGGDHLCHPEVLGNLLSAMAAHDRPRYQRRIDAGSQWLLTQRQPEGWAAYWYWGWGYGTLRAIQALREASPDACPDAPEAVRETLQRLIARQKPDGSWIPGRTPVERYQEAASRPSVLETAFSLEALAAAGNWAPAEASQAIRRSAEWLVSRQEADGGWPSEPLYFTLGRTPYQSREVTSAIALSALLSAKLSS